MNAVCPKVAAFDAVCLVVGTVVCTSRRPVGEKFLTYLFVLVLPV